MRNFCPSINIIRCTSPLGPMVLAATKIGLAGVWFDNQRHLPPVLAAMLGMPGSAAAGDAQPAASSAVGNPIGSPVGSAMENDPGSARPIDSAAAAWPRNDRHPVLLRARAQLDRYFGSTIDIDAAASCAPPIARCTFDLPLDLRIGTPFQQAVWLALCAIPAGRTTSYGAIARAIGRPLAVRAVGAAIGRNPISIVVPCHRVVGAQGALTGYAGGLERKVALLQREGAMADAALSGLL